MRSVRITRGDLAQVAADVLIVPTRRGFSGRGTAAQVADRLTAEFGFDPRAAIAGQLEGDARLALGEAAVLLPPPEARARGCPAVVCACVVDDAGGVTEASVEAGAAAALDAVEGLRAAGLEVRVEPHGAGTLCVAVPSLGTGTTGNLTTEAAARAMRRAIEGWRRAPAGPADELVVVIWSPRSLRRFLAVFDRLGARGATPVGVASRATGADGQEQLAGCLANRQAILFVGSGLSFNALPPKASWTDLFRPEWLEEFRDPDASRLRLRSDVEIVDVAQIVVDRYDKATLEATFAEDLLTRSRPSLIHYQLLDLPWSAILTTNYDTLIEDTLAALRIPHTVVTHDEQVAGLDDGLGVPVIKVHGGFCAPDCDLPHDSPSGLKYSRLVTTRDEFDSYFAKSPAMGAYLESKLLTSHGLIVGYSVRDPHMRQLFARIGSTGRRRGQRARRLFWLTTSPCPIEPYWNERGVEILTANHKDGTFRAFLAEAATRAQRIRSDALLPPGHLGEADWDRFFPDDAVLSAEQQRTLLRCLVEAGLSPPARVMRRVMSLAEVGDREIDWLARLHHSPDTTSAFESLGGGGDGRPG